MYGNESLYYFFRWVAGGGAAAAAGLDIYVGHYTITRMPQQPWQS